MPRAPWKPPLPSQLPPPRRFRSLVFVHEDSGQSFILDIADLFRDELTVPCAFKAALAAERRPGDSIERLTRRSVGERLRREQVIPAMIDRIKSLFAEEPEG